MTEFSVEDESKFDHEQRDYAKIPSQDQINEIVASERRYLGLGDGQYGYATYYDLAFDKTKTNIDRGTIVAGKVIDKFIDNPSLIMDDRLWQIGTITSAETIHSVLFGNNSEDVTSDEIGKALLLLKIRWKNVFGDQAQILGSRTLENNASLDEIMRDMRINYLSIGVLQKIKAMSTELDRNELQFFPAINDHIVLTAAMDRRGRNGTHEYHKGDNFHHINISRISNKVNYLLGVRENENKPTDFEDIMNELDGLANDGFQRNVEGSEYMKRLFITYCHEQGHAIYDENIEQSMILKIEELLKFDVDHSSGQFKLYRTALSEAAAEFMERLVIERMISMNEGAEKQVWERIKTLVDDDINQRPGDEYVLGRAISSTMMVALKTKLNVDNENIQLGEALGELSKDETIRLLYQIMDEIKLEEFISYN